MAYGWTSMAFFFPFSFSPFAFLFSSRGKLTSKKKIYIICFVATIYVGDLSKSVKKRWLFFFFNSGLRLDTSCIIKLAIRKNKSLFREPSLILLSFWRLSSFKKLMGWKLNEESRPYSTNEIHPRDAPTSLLSAASIISICMPFKSLKRYAFPAPTKSFFYPFLTSFRSFNKIKFCTTIYILSVELLFGFGCISLTFFLFLNLRSHDLSHRNLAVSTLQHRFAFLWDHPLTFNFNKLSQRNNPILSFWRRQSICG